MYYHSNKVFKLLQHYFKTVWLKAGLEWTSDNDQEIWDIVNTLIFLMESK